MTTAKAADTVLRQVDSLLASESQWTKQAMAKDANGEKVSIINLNATCWCLVGAVNKIFSTLPFDEQTNMVAARIQDALEYGIEKIDGRPQSPIWFNDHPQTTFAEIKAVLAGAMEYTKQ